MIGCVILTCVMFILMGYSMSDLRNDMIIIIIIMFIIIVMFIVIIVIITISARRRASSHSMYVCMYVCM